MRGVVYDFRVARWLLARVAGRRVPAFYDGSFSCLALRTLPSRALPGPRWVRLRPLLSGICGSDLATITAHTSPVLSAFTAFPVVLGHEVVAEVLEVGRDVHRVQVGDRVVVNPFFGCEVRGISPPCPPCQEGFTALCQNAAEGPMAPGMLMGFCPDQPGAWSNECLCHESQCFAVPSALSLEQAVLVEPLAVGLHAALMARPQPQDTVLVIGGGMIAFSVLAALAWIASGAKIVHSFWEAFQAPLSAQFGAQVQALRETPEMLARRVGCRAYRPRLGPLVFTGGYDVVFDCVGSPASVDAALRLARPRGRVILVGSAATLPGIDWAFVWSRELLLTGSMGYGPEPLLGSPPYQHTFDWTIRYLTTTDIPVSTLITHRLPLSEYRAAVRANLDRGRYRAVKLVFDLRLPERGRAPTSSALS
jgi:L-iditol 2-dehydrogenase